MDRNSQGALRIAVTAERPGRCDKGRGRHRCVKRRAFVVKDGKGTKYRATASRLPRGRATIRLRVGDAVGNRRRPDVTRRVRIR